jgi:hypothetical protein
VGHRAGLDDMEKWRLLTYLNTLCESSSEVIHNKCSSEILCARILVECICVSVLVKYLERVF